MQVYIGAISIGSIWIMSQRMTKPTKWHVRPAKTRVRLGIHPVWSVFAVRAKKPWVNGYLYIERTAKTLIRLGGCPGWSKSSLGARDILLVLSCAGAINYIYIYKSTSWDFTLLTLSTQTSELLTIVLPEPNRSGWLSVDVSINLNVQLTICWCVC